MEKVDWVIGIIRELYCTKGQRELSAGTPCKILMVIWRLWISPHLEDCYFSCLIHWVIENDEEFCRSKGKRRLIGLTRGKYSFVIFRLLIVLNFYNLCRLLIRLSGDCDNLNSYLSRLTRIHYFIFIKSHQA